jgi:hypothetical protein
MASTVIGHLLVGTTDPNDGGIHPSHLLLFVLGDFGPSRLELLSFSDRSQFQTWVPVRDETMLHDAMLMVGLCVFRFPSLVELAKSLTNEEPIAPQETDDEGSEGSGPFRQRPLPRGWISVAKRYFQIERLREACRLIEDQQGKVVLTVLGKSRSPFLHWEDLMKYHLNVEVCCNVYHREHSPWSGGWTTGSGCSED